MQAMPAVGLCANCLYTRQLSNDRGSVFHLCELGLQNPAFRKYPTLPVLRCCGFQRRPEEPLCLTKTTPPGH